MYVQICDDFDRLLRLFLVYRHISCSYYLPFSFVLGSLRYAGCMSIKYSKLSAMRGGDRDKYGTYIFVSLGCRRYLGTSSMYKASWLKAWAPKICVDIDGFLVLFSEPGIFRSERTPRTFLGF